MATLYAYRGAPALIEAVGPRLTAAGFKRTEEVAAASVALTFCTSQTALEDVYFGDDGLVTTMGAGSTLVDLSATTPSFAREVNAVATVNDLVMVEAPLTVRSLVAESALSRENLVAPVASEGDIPPEARALLDAVFGEVVEAGVPGAAQLARSGHILSLTAHLVSVVEAAALADATRRSASTVGIEMAADLLGALDDPVVRAVREERFAGAYTVEMLLAELSAALMAADDAEAILPQTEAAMHMLELLAVIGGADMAPCALALVYRDEEAGAAHGLDWTRAEQAYGRVPSEDGEWDEGDDGCGCGHSHGHSHGRDDYDDYDDYGDYDTDDYDDFDYRSN